MYLPAFGIGLGVVDWLNIIRFRCTAKVNATALTFKMEITKPREARRWWTYVKGGRDTRSMVRDELDEDRRSTTGKTA